MLYKKLYKSRKSVLLSLFVLLIPNIILPMQASTAVSSSNSSTRQDPIDRIWANAPTSVKVWADELQKQDGSICDRPYRLFLYGVPGTGKSKLARGIARQNPDWAVEHIDAADCGSRYRGGTAINLKEKLEAILEKQDREKVKMIVIIDEAHTLLEKYNEEGSDSGMTGEVLRRFLDTQLELDEKFEDDNQDLMIIFTGNEVSDMKPSLESRVQAYGIEILPPSPSELYEIFKYYTGDYSFEELDVEHMYHIFEVGNMKVGRDIVDFVKKLKRAISESGYRGPLNQYMVTVDFLEQVARSFRESKRKFGSERDHSSQRAFSRQLQREAQEENRRLQKEAQEHQERLQREAQEHQQRLHDISERNNDKKHQETLTQNEKLSNRNIAVSIGVPVATFAAGYVANKYINSEDGQSDTVSQSFPDSVPSELEATQAQSSEQSSGSSVVGNAVKTVGAVGAVAVAHTVATGATASTASSAVSAVANTGIVAQVGTALTTGGEVILAAASAHPAVAFGVAFLGLVGVTNYYNSQSNDEPEQTDEAEQEG